MTVTWPLQVEVLLRSFSASLQQQIKHRRHFYKSAVLVRKRIRYLLSRLHGCYMTITWRLQVREGILVLHGDELGADLTQTLAEIDRRMLDFVVGLDTECARSASPPTPTLRWWSHQSTPLNWWPHHTARPNLAGSPS